MKTQTNLTATIPRDGSLSNVLDCSIGKPVFIYMPAAWTPATLSFQISADGATFTDLFTREGQELSFNVLGATAVRIDPKWSAMTFVRLRSGSREKAIPQAAVRDIVITLDTAGVAP
jgi:hypothetical protein